MYKVGLYTFIDEYKTFFFLLLSERVIGIKLFQLSLKYVKLLRIS